MERNIISIRSGDAELSRRRGEIMSESLNPTPDAEQLMFGAIPGKPALGRGPAVDGEYSRHPYHHPADGIGFAPLPVRGACSVNDSRHGHDKHHANTAPLRTPRRAIRGSRLRHLGG